MRLIDADAFIKMMEEKCDPESTLDPWVLSVCRGGVKIIPTVDAVPVVRCCECRWWHDWNGECYAKEAQGFGHLWNADDYCSYGERKDGDGK